MTCWCGWATGYYGPAPDWCSHCPDAYARKVKATYHVAEAWADVHRRPVAVAVGDVVFRDVTHRRPPHTDGMARLIRALNLG